jgi:hypothetical protein
MGVVGFDKLLQRIHSSDDAYEEKNDRHDKKDVDKPADCVDTDDAEKPQYEQNDG